MMTEPTTRLLLLRDLNKPQRDAFMAAGKHRVLAKGEQLCMHGAPLCSVFFVTEGAVRTFRHTPDGKEITLMLAMPGDMVGGEHLSESFTHHQWNAVAAEPSSAVLEYDRQWLRAALRNDATLALNLLAMLAQQTHIAAVDAEQLVNFSAPQRVACFMLRLCALYGYSPSAFTLPFSKSTIASKLGMEVETFSRALGKLKEFGVAVQGAEVRIARPQVLECFACGSCSTGEDCATLAKLHAAGASKR